MLTTSASWTEPTGYLLSMFSQGLASFCLRPRAIFSLSLSIDRTLTSISWSILSISLGWLMRPQDMSVMCSRPSMPPRSMNAPKSAMFLTVPLTDLADLQAVERLALQLLALLLDHLAAGDDDVAALFVDLEDDRVDVAADPVADLAGPADVDLAGGEEDGHADVDQQAALDLLGDLAGDRVALLLGLHDGFPVDDAISLALADLHQTGVAFDVFEEDLDFVADLDVLGFVEFAALEDAFALEAQLDDEIVAGHRADAALDDRAGGEVLDFVAGDQDVQIVGGLAQGVHHGRVDVVVVIGEC